MKILKSFTKKLTVLIVSAAIAAMAIPFSASAATATDTGTGSVNSNIEIDGNIAATTISVTHPVTETYNINPDKNTFSALPITVTNNTVVPIKVTVQSLKSIPSTGAGTLTFTDKLPADENWGALNCADSKTYLALGIKITDKTGWNEGCKADTDWAASNAPMYFGDLASNASGNFNLTANFGRAFDAAYTAKHALVFMFDLV